MKKLHANITFFFLRLFMYYHSWQNKKRFAKNIPGSDPIRIFIEKLNLEEEPLRQIYNLLNYG